MAKQSTQAAKTDAAKPETIGQTDEKTVEAPTTVTAPENTATASDTKDAPAAAQDDDQGETIEGTMMVAEQVLLVSAPGGPRRRAGIGFGPIAVELRWDDLGKTDEERLSVLERLRADPLLKIDGRMEERPADD